MKKIILLLIFLYSTFSISQTSSGMEQDFDYGIKNNSSQQILTPDTLVTKGVDGTYGHTSAYRLPISNDTYDSLQTKVPYTGATSNVDLGEFGSTNGFLGLDTTPTGTPTGIGTIYWDSVNKTASLIDGVGATTLQIGQEERTLIHNSTGSTLTDGQVVYVTGSTGALPSVALASATIESTSAATLGVVTESIPNGSSGFVSTTGIVNGLNTLAFNEGDILWLSNTSGEFTNVKPTSPSHLVLIGYVIKKAGGNGSILVKIQNTQELAESSDVLFGTLANNDLLVYESSTGLWKNKTAASVGLVSGTGTTNTLPKFTGASTLGNSNLSDNGTIVTSTTDMLVNGLRVGRGEGNIISNVTIGSDAGLSNISGVENVKIGFEAGKAATGNRNVLIGNKAGTSILGGFRNTVIGNEALKSSTSGDHNVVFGNTALSNATSTVNNVIIGSANANLLSDGITPLTSISNSIFLGFGNKSLNDSSSNQIVIGFNTSGLGSNTTVIGNSSTTQTWLGGKLTVGKTTNDGVNDIQSNGTVSSGNTTLGTSQPTANNQLTRKDYVDTADNLKANLAGTQTFTGVHNFPTATAGTNTTQVATTAFVQSAVTNSSRTTLKYVGSVARTGSTGYARLIDILIPANTIPATSVWKLYVSAHRDSGTAAGSAQVELDIAQSTEGGTPMIRGTNIGTAANSIANFERTIRFGAGNRYVFSNSGAFYTDIGSNVPITTNAFNPAIDNHIFAGINLSNASDTYYIDYVILERID